MARFVRPAKDLVYVGLSVAPASCRCMSRQDAVHKATGKMPVAHAHRQDAGATLAAPALSAEFADLADAFWFLDAGDEEWPFRSAAICAICGLVASNRTETAW